MGRQPMPRLRQRAIVTVVPVIGGVGWEAGLRTWATERFSLLVEERDGYPAFDYLVDHSVLSKAVRSLRLFRITRADLAVIALVYLADLSLQLPTTGQAPLRL